MFLSVTEVVPCRVRIWLDSMLFSLGKSFKQLEKQDFVLPDKTRNRRYCQPPPNKQKTASADIQRTMEKDVKVTHTFDCI